MTTKVERPMPREFNYEIPLSEFQDAFGIDPSETLQRGTFLPHAVIITTRRET